MPSSSPLRRGRPTTRLLGIGGLLGVLVGGCAAVGGVGPASVAAPTPPASSSSDPAPTSTTPGSTAVNPVGPATVDDVRGVHLTASTAVGADRPAMTLVDGRGRAGDHDCILDGPAPVLADLDGDGTVEAVATMTCRAAGARRPARVVVAGSGGRLLAEHSLYRGETTTRVEALTALPHGVAVRWQGEDSGTARAHSGLLRIFDGNPVFSDDPTPATSTTATPSTATPSTGAPTTDVPVTPAPSTSPSGAPSPGPTSEIGTGTASFASPTGGLRCSMGPASTRCDALGAPAAPGCSAQWGLSVRLVAGRAAEVVCEQDPAYTSPAPTSPTWWVNGTDPLVVVGSLRLHGLAYGRELVGATTTCTVDPRSGVTCRSADGAHGFTLSKARHRTW